MCQLIAIYCSFIQNFNLYCQIKLLSERCFIAHRKIINQNAKKLARMIQKKNLD